MQMLPVPTPTSSTDNNYVDLSVVSTHIESLRVKLTPIMGNPVTPNPDKNQLKPTTSKKLWLTKFYLNFEILVNLGTSPSARRRVGTLPFSSAQPTPDLARWINIYSRLIKTKEFLSSSERTRAKYQAILQNSGLFHINGQVDNRMFSYLKTKLFVLF